MRLLLLLLSLPLAAETVKVPGVEARVEIRRDKWGVPHIYARNSHDLFFAQGWITAKDRLFQIDLWRRTGTGKLSEALGPQHVARDRIARLVRYRGDWEEEWRAYSDDAKEIATAFTDGINAYIRSLKKLPVEFEASGYEPGLWQPEDVTARIAGLQMLRNATFEMRRALGIQRYGLDVVQKLDPPNPSVPLTIPNGLDLKLLRPEMMRDYAAAVGPVRLEDGSNNWAVDGTLSATGGPLMASDPHRALQVPSLRKIVHLVAPGWDVIGAGEPALPGIALGHNEEIAWGFTIVGIDQQDLYVEKLNPLNPRQYRDRGEWRDMEVEEDSIPVRRGRPVKVELKYTHHGPVIWEDPSANIALALKWVGAEPGGAGYLSALRLSRAKNWEEFRAAAGKYKTPSENLVYADRAGNIGWIASGRAPIRKNWNGLLPVPGDTGEYEWSGYLTVDDLPQTLNPPEHWLGTANTNHLPAGYPHAIGFDFTAPFRFQRLQQMFSEPKKFTIADFARMQYDVTSVPAHRFQKVVAVWKPVNARHQAIRERFGTWDARILAESTEALIFEMWMLNLPKHLFGEVGAITSWSVVLNELETARDDAKLSAALDESLAQLEKLLGPEGSRWKWGELHQLGFRHPVNRAAFHIAPEPVSGDGNTVFAANWSATQPFRMNHGASYRQILDPKNWDNSVVTNVPGESGNPGSPHYKDLLSGWRAGNPHPLPYTRKAVEAATAERILLVP
jgi:penicillin amidase